MDRVNFLKKDPYEVKFSGLGGQGIILSGMILGKAVSIYDRKHASLIKSFGPEARGSACSSQVVISETPVLYPYVKNADLLISLSQVAYGKFEKELNSEAGILVYESELVTPKTKERSYGIPATRLSEENLGKSVYLNILVLGFLTKLTGIVSPGAVKEAIKSTVPVSTIENNIKAFSIGYEYSE